MNKKFNLLGFVLFVIATTFAFVANSLFLKIEMFQFVGILLAVIIVLAVIINFAVKFKNRKKNDNSFILPTAVANKMTTLNMGIQYEATIISLSFLIVGMALFSVYFVFFTGFDWIFKGFYIFNSVCGIVLMISMLVTAWQQYMSWKESSMLIEAFKNTPESNGEIISAYNDRPLTNHLKGGL